MVAIKLADLVNEQLATKRDLKELEMRLVLRLGSMMVGGIAVVATLVKNQGVRVIDLFQV